MNNKNLHDLTYILNRVGKKVNIYDGVNRTATIIEATIHNGCVYVLLSIDGEHKQITLEKFKEIVRKSK